MKDNPEKYEKLVEILRNSRPSLLQPELIEQVVIGKIKDKSRFESTWCFVENAFVWIYVGWIRKSLISLSLFISVLFIYQQVQTFISVKNIKKEAVSEWNGTGNINFPNLDTKLLVLKASSGLLPGKSTAFYENQIRELNDSYNELLLRYESIIKLIREDPMLMDYIELRLQDKNKTKSKI